MTNVLVTFLGSGDAFGSGGMFQTCISVASAQTHFLLDCGASSLIALQGRGSEPVLRSPIALRNALALLKSASDTLPLPGSEVLGCRTLQQKVLTIRLAPDHCPNHCQKST